jgi:sporulation protein YqfC
MGIGEYSSENIHINVKFGWICVKGTDLELCCMTAEQLVITGNIEMVSLRKGRS